MYNLKLIVDRCVDECIRQQVGLVEAGLLIRAYAWALKQESDIPSLAEINVVAHVIDGRNSSYRTVPVTFTNGGGAVQRQNIPEVLDTMWRVLEDGTDVDAFVKAFLFVHPYIDGNARTAFILYNWLNKTLENPEPLPNYFEESLTI